MLAAILMAGPADQTRTPPAVPKTTRVTRSGTPEVKRGSKICMIPGTLTQRAGILGVDTDEELVMLVFVMTKPCLREASSWGAAQRRSLVKRCSYGAPRKHGLVTELGSVGPANKSPLTSPNPQTPLGKVPQALLLISIAPLQHATASIPSSAQSPPQTPNPARLSRTLLASPLHQGSIPSQPAHLLLVQLRASTHSVATSP